MAIKKYKPTSNGRRNMTTSDFAAAASILPICLAQALCYSVVLACNPWAKLS